MKRTPIRKISKKQSKRLREYSKLKKTMNITTCKICGASYSDYKNIDLHHIEHKGMGGKDTKENLVGLCRNCHMIEHGQIEYYRNDSPHQVKQDFIDRNRNVK